MQLPESEEETVYPHEMKAADIRIAGFKQN